MDVYSQLIEELDLYCIQMPVSIDIGKLINIIGENGISRSKRLENASKYLGITKKDKQSYEILKLIWFKGDFI